MDKIKGLRIGLAINHIAQMCDERTLKRVDPFLKEIEDICLSELDVEVDGTEKIKETMCDEFCRFPSEATDEQDLHENHCAGCPLNKL